MAARHERGERRRGGGGGGQRGAGRALNNRFNWVMHEEVTYARGSKPRGSRPSVALPTSAGSAPRAPAILSALHAIRCWPSVFWLLNNNDLLSSRLCLFRSIAPSTLMTYAGIYLAQTVALNRSSPFFNPLSLESNRTHRWSKVQDH